MLWDQPHSGWLVAIRAMERITLSNHVESQLILITVLMDQNGQYEIIHQDKPIYCNFWLVVLFRYPKGPVMVYFENR